MRSTASLIQQNDHFQPGFINIPLQNAKPWMKFSFTKKDASPAFLREDAPYQDNLLQDDHAKATRCIYQIADSLWKDICMDLLHMMGPASVLKIWESKLGEFSSSDKHIDITCETEDRAKFVQQYDFVILGSLQRYFPALKELRVSI